MSTQAYTKEIAGAAHGAFAEDVIRKTGKHSTSAKIVSVALSLEHISAQPLHLGCVAFPIIPTLLQLVTLPRVVTGCCGVLRGSGRITPSG